MTNKIYSVEYMCGCRASGHYVQQYCPVHGEPIVSVIEYPSDIKLAGEGVA